MSTPENIIIEKSPVLSTTPESFPHFVVNALSTEDDYLDSSYKLHQSQIEINSDMLHLLNLHEERIAKLEAQVQELSQQK